MSTTMAPEEVFTLRDRVTSASIVVLLIGLAYFCSTAYDLAILTTGISSIFYFICTSIFDIVLWYAAKRCTFTPLSPTMREVINVTVSITISILLPDSIFLQMVPWVKYASFLWLLFQACIVIDMAHELHALILTRAEHSLYHRGSHAGRIHLAFHITLSIVLLMITAYLSTNLIRLTSCDSFFLHFLTLVCVVGTLVSLSERCNKGALIPAIVGLYSMLCCYDALLSTNHNTGYYYYVKCYYNSESNNHFSPFAISTLLGTYKLWSQWGLTLVSTVCILYGAAYGSPTIVFFYDRLLIFCCPSGCTHAFHQWYLLLLRRISSMSTWMGWNGTLSTGGSVNNMGTMTVLSSSKEDDTSLVYQDISLDYRFVLDPDIATKLRSCEAGETIKFVTTDTLVDSRNHGSLSSSSQQQSYATSSSSGGRDQRFGGSNNHPGQNRNGHDMLAEGSSLLPSSSSSSSSSTFALTGDSLHLAIQTPSIPSQLEKRYTSTVFGGHYKALLFVLLSCVSAYLSLVLTDWSGCYSDTLNHTEVVDHWRPADQAGDASPRFAVLLIHPLMHPT